MIRQRIPRPRRVRQPNFVFAEHCHDGDLILMLEEKSRADGEEVERADGQAPVERGFGGRFIEVIGLGLPLTGERYRLVLRYDVRANHAPLTDVEILEVDHGERVAERRAADNGSSQFADP